MIYSIGNVPITINNRIVFSDFSANNAAIDSITTGSSITSYLPFNLNVSVYNSGYTHNYYLYVTSNTDNTYKITGSTYTINNNSTKQWVLSGIINVTGTTTINVKLYSNGTLINEKNQDFIVSSPNYVVATGGIITNYTSGNTNYTVHSMLSGTTVFNVLSGGLIDIFMIGGGGGGSGGVNFVNYGGGGAGGTSLVITDYNISINSYNVVVGSGGTGSIQSKADDGANSTFLNFIASGGTGHLNTSRTGGSNYLYNGGTNSSGVNCGGGAGGGGNGSSNTGGIGVVNNLRTGSNVQYCGGGGGGPEGSASYGGTPAIGGTSTNCANNTGGGGGGGNAGAKGGNGGSGIVVIRYISA